MIGFKSKDTVRRDRSALEQMLREAGADVKGKAIRCPFHEDRHASGGIYQGDDGVWRFKCQAACCNFGGDVYDVMARHSGKPVEDLLREVAAHDRPTTRSSATTTKPTPKPVRLFKTVAEIRQAVESYARVENVHVYTHPDTKAIELVVVRTKDAEGRKRFCQYQPADGGFIIDAPPKPWPLYNRTRLKDAADVVVVEGEKCVEAMTLIGVPATTSPCGAGKASSADWSPLAGKTVYLWPDADPPDPQTGKRTGIDHMREVAAILEKLNPPPRVYWFDPDRLELPPKGDCVDFLARLPADDDKADAVWRVLTETSEELGAAGEVGMLIEEAISGKWRALDWPMPKLGRQTRALLPATVTLVCGDPGSSKSLLMLESFCHWHEQGIKVALYELEDQRRFHALRVLAQMSGVSAVTDDAWLREHPDKARAFYAEFRARLESFGKTITSPGTSQPTPSEMAAWVEKQCAAGVQVIGIDPITDVAYSDRPWKDDREFMWRARNAIVRTGARLVLVTHPRKGGGAAKGGSALDDAAGGAIYTRGSQTVLWIARQDPPEQMTVKTQIGEQQIECDRIIKILKARNGVGAGAWIGYQFMPDSLRFSEQGLVVKTSKGKAKSAQYAPVPVPVQDPFVDDVP